MNSTIDEKIEVPKLTKEQFEEPMAGQVVKESDLSGKVLKFYDNLKGDEDIKDHLEKNTEYGKLLEKHVQDAFTKYESNLNALSTKANTALSALGTAGDAYFFYDPIGGLGIKAISTIGKTVVELPNLVSYVGKSGDYLSLGTFAMMKAVSYLPLATLADRGMKHIVKKRILKEAKRNFLKEIGVEKESYLAKLKKVYTNVKDRASNVFKPDYEPALA